MRDHPAEPEDRIAGILEEFVGRIAVQCKPADDPATLEAAAVMAFEAFAAAGIEALLLKGAALARLLYLPGESRVYCDVDILVRPSDMESARQVLAQLGYRDATAALGIDDVGGVIHDESWVGSGPNGGSEVLIELHRWLAGSRAAPEVAWDALIARRATLELHGQRVPILSPDGLAMHLALHAAHHGPAYIKGCRELSLGLQRWSADVWERASMLAAAIDATAPFAAGLRLVPTGRELAATLELPRTDRLDWEIANHGARPRGTFHLQALREVRGLRARLQLLRRAALPRSTWVSRQYPWARHGGYRLLAAYALHLLHAVPMAARAWRFQRGARRAGDYKRRGS